MLTLLLLMIKAWFWATGSTLAALLATMAVQRLLRAWPARLARVGPARVGGRRSEPGAA